MRKYPRFSFRLGAEDQRRLETLSLIRSRSRGEVVREAIDMYYRIKTQPPKP